MTKIGVLFGGWSTNIGNAFFQLGALAAIERACPDAHVGVVCEQPGYPMYWNSRGGNPPNAVDAIALSNVDVVVLLGPIFRNETETIWSETFSKLKRAGKRIAMLGVGAMTYRGEDVDRYQRLLERFPPDVFSSRDRDTFELLGRYSRHRYDGIDFGFLVPLVYTPAGMQDDRSFVVLNFDKVPEPSIEVGPSFTDGKQTADYEFDFQGNRWKLTIPKMRWRMARRSRYLMMLEGFVFPGATTTNIGTYDIIRTDHRSNPTIARKTYRSPNTLVNDTPYPYLEAYASAELVLTCRLHACVAALAYGRPALLCSDSPRARLLERVGVSDIRQQPASLSPTFLQQEQNGLMDFLGTCLVSG